MKKRQGFSITRAPFVMSALAAVIGGTTAEGALAQLQANESLEEITVTGSRIRQTSGFTTPIPVTAVTMDELSALEPGNTISEQLDALPQFFGNTSAQNRPTAMVAGSGTSSLNLRDLGAGRTLVLFDNSRVVPADISGAVNIDALPTALIRTVDVVTGGASAAYGADAVGGVVNFILDREFQGLVVDAGTGVSDEGDNGRWDVSVAGGTRIGERVNIIGSAEMRHINQAIRHPQDLDSSWWQNWGWVTNPQWAAGDRSVPQRLTLPWISSTTESPYGMIWSGPRGRTTGFSLNGHVFTDNGSAVRPFTRGDVWVSPTAPGTTRTQSGGPEGQAWNLSGQRGPVGSEVEARSIFGGLQYELSDTVTFFGQALVARQETNGYDMRQNQARMDSIWAPTVFRENPFLPPEVAAAMAAQGINSFQLHSSGQFLGAMRNTLDGKERFTTASGTVGVDVALPNDWDLRASWQSGTSTNKSMATGISRVDRFHMAADAVRDPATGAIVCRVQLFNPTPAQLAETPAVRGRLNPKTINTPNEQPLLSPVGLDNSIRDCTPLNIMATDWSQTALDYISTPRSEDSEVEQDFAEIFLTGDLIDAWAGPISFAGGLTWRDQNFVQTIESAVDYLGPALNAPELGIRGINSGFTGGSETLHQFSSLRPVAGETKVWEWFGELNAPLWEAATGQQRLDTNVAYRSSDYERSGRIESWKLGLNFQLLESIRLRATKSADVREPTFNELYNNRGGGGGSVEDPRFNNQVFQITVPSGGNSELAPEQAETLTAGVVLQPTFLEGLQLAVDWYSVEIRDAIGTLGAQRIVEDCELTREAQLCSRVLRNADGVITKVSNVNVNVDQAKVEGVDLEFSWRLEPDFFSNETETLTVRGLAGHLIERSDTPRGGVTEDQAGQLGTPDLTGLLTLGYSLGPWNAQLQQRYIADTILNIDWVEGVDVDDNSVASGNYTNLRLGYEGETGGGNEWNVSFNITNLFDRNPPIVAGGTGQVIPDGYDTWGRRYQLGFTVRL